MPRAPGLIIAAPRSGAGKTMVALGVMRALARGGLAVQPFKCGPDYIDPAFHAAAAGRPSFNLDTWAMRGELIAGLIETSLLGVHSAAAGNPPLPACGESGGVRGSNGPRREILPRTPALSPLGEWGEGGRRADIAIAEGVMGLFDGVAEPGQSGRGATADVARLTGWPIVLVLDVSGQSETAAAVALGCATYRPDIRIAGVILNRLGSARQEGLIVPAIERVGLPVLGCLRRCDDLTLPERHLGLVQALETDDLESRLDAIADAVAGGVRLFDLTALAVPATLAGARSGGAADGRQRAPLAPPGQRIALARDRAFAFMYPHIVAGWRAAGAEIMPFSPLADERPDPGADAVWLPGGYPELYAGEIAGADRFRAGLRDMAGRSIPIHGECGGYMVLGAGLVDEAGDRHRMAGLLAVETSFARRKLHLGYRRARLIDRSPLGPSGTILYGHEFHYASLLGCHDEPLADVEDASGAPQPEHGSRRGTVTGTFFHVIDRAG